MLSTDNRLFFVSFYWNLTRSWWADWSIFCMNVFAKRRKLNHRVTICAYCGFLVIFVRGSWIILLLFDWAVRIIITESETLKVRINSFVFLSAFFFLFVKSFNKLLIMWILKHFNLIVLIRSNHGWTFLSQRTSALSGQSIHLFR